MGPPARRQDLSTPLIAAVCHRRARIARLLLETDAVDVERADGTGTTPLMHAAAATAEGIALLLLAHGAARDAVDNAGRRAVDRVAGESEGAPPAKGAHGDADTTKSEAATAERASVAEVGGTRERASMPPEEAMAPSTAAREEEETAGEERAT